MNVKHFFSKQTIQNVSRLNSRISNPCPCSYRSAAASATSFPVVASILAPSTVTSNFGNRSHWSPILCFSRYVHSAEEIKLSDSNTEGDATSEEDETMNEFLSRFVWIMRGKLYEVYTDLDKKTIDSMLLVIVGKVVSEMEKGGFEQMLSAAVDTPSQDFSDDLWKTVWEVSNMVLADMNKAKKKEKMKGFLQSEEVKEMCRFAGEVGIRGDLLRELRFKWAREKMEESEFYKSLESLREKEAMAEEKENDTVEKTSEFTGEIESGEAKERSKVFTLPKRQGKIKYKIYGLDFSGQKWAEVADKIHEHGELIWPQEPKPITGKCKIVTEKIVSLQEEDDLSALLDEWVDLLQPSRIDWITLLDRIKEHNSGLYFKVAEHLLDEESFQANIRDYSKLIDAHAKANSTNYAERILKKMNEKGILPDIMTSTILVHMYSKSGELEKAKAAFEILRSHGFQPDTAVYNSMIMAYVNSGQPKLGESLMREMEARDIKPTEEIYMALLRSFARRGDVTGAQRIATTMQFAGFKPGPDSCALLVEAFGQAGDPDQARHHFDHMMKIGYKPDDRCMASMIAAYEKKNLLDKALNLLLELEKDGFVPGLATYTVLVDWLGQLQLINEAEEVLGKISGIGGGPPFRIHVTLCDMYARAGIERKALQALGVLEDNKNELGADDFERIINALIKGGFVQDARRVHGLMEAQGFPASEPLKVSLMASQALRRNRPGMR